MIITIDTEKDSKEDIKAIIAMLQKEIGPPKLALEKETAEEMLSTIIRPKKEEMAPEIPKSAKEAYELAEDLETY